MTIRRLSFIFSFFFLLWNPAHAFVDAPINQSGRLSQWMLALQNQNPDFQKDAYLPGLIWSRSTEIPYQKNIRRRLVDQIRLRGLSSLERGQAAEKLIQHIESWPITGRVPVEKIDPRWMEAHPAHDPLLAKGDRVFIPDYPQFIWLLNGEGSECRVMYHSEAHLIDYVSSCGWSRNADYAWLIQPDGWIQRAGIALWNLSPQDAPAPGARILIEDNTGWLPDTYAQLASVLSSLGVETMTIPSILTTTEAKPNNWLNQPRTPIVLRNDFGTVGLLQTPTARMMPAGTIGISTSKVEPYRRYNVLLQPLDWFELNAHYSQTHDLTTDAGSYYLDKGVDFKVRLAKETRAFPEIAIGTQDIGGTGLFSGEYLVASKRLGAIDWSLGLGWGYLGQRGSITNPLSVFSNSYKKRGGVSGTVGGEFNVKSLFTGPTALFGGAQYQTPWDPLILKLEYDGNNYSNEQGRAFRTSSSLNYGLTWQLNRNMDVSLAWERGNTLGIRFSLQADYSGLFIPKVSDPEPLSARALSTPKADWAQSARDIEQQTQWKVKNISRNTPRELTVLLDRATAGYWQERLNRTTAILNRDAPLEIERFRLASEDRGLQLSDLVVDREDWNKSRIQPVSRSEQNIPVIEEPARAQIHKNSNNSLFTAHRPPFKGDAGLHYSQTLGGIDSFLFYQIAASATGELKLSDKTWINGAINYRLIDNYDDYKISAGGALPRVRTLQRDFTVTERLTIPLLQMTHVEQIGTNQFASVYGGILEWMYAGYGAEWLYRPWASSLAFGVDINRVQQRGFKGDFSLREYKTTTGHGTVYWDLGWENLFTTVSAGQYLAGDRGVTIDVSKRFNNGVRMGAFITKTNVSSEQFGEGSFDKGIYFSVPLDAFLTRSTSSSAGVLWRPITRDGGAKLIRSQELYGISKRQAAQTLAIGPAEPQVERQQTGSQGIVASQDDPVSIASSLPLGVYLPPDYLVPLKAPRTQVMDRSINSDSTPTIRVLPTLGLIGIAALLDHSVEHTAQKYRQKTASKTLAQFGKTIPWLWLGLAGASAIEIENDQWGRTSTAAFEAGSTALLTSLALKSALHRERPDHSARDSFPSSHASTLWAVATPYARSYDAPWIYALAGLGSLGRVAEGRHWLSDVVAGSLLGYTLGNLSYWAHSAGEKEGKTRWEINPYGIALRIRFDL